MTIDIHSLLEKNPITKKMLQPKFGYKYLGPYNGPLENKCCIINELERFTNIMINLKMLLIKLLQDMIYAMN